MGVATYRVGIGGRIVRLSDSSDQESTNRAEIHKIVPSPPNDSRKRRTVTSGNQPPGPPGKWFDNWGPALLVLLTNIIVMAVTAAYAIGAFSERIDSVEDDIAELKSTTESIQEEIGKINENYVRLDVRLEGLERNVDRLTAAVDALNETIIRLMIEVEQNEATK